MQNKILKIKPTIQFIYTDINRLKEGDIVTLRVKIDEDFNNSKDTKDLVELKWSNHNLPVLTGS